MANLGSNQKPIRLAGSGKRDVRTQFGALPWRLHDGKLEILLITSRDTGRWIIPKGWPMDGATPAEAAATEAWEEAGVEGKLSNAVLGFYGYTKQIEEVDDYPIVVAVFPIQVKKLAADWPERRERRRHWFPAKKAATVVSEPELRQIIKTFDPRKMHR
ncbi:MAG: NUDIX hydrolase [Maritimibacter sp.]|nr:NUDIX hydrolase [Maritimibacter sp.]